MIPNGRDSSLFHPRSEPAEAADATLIFVGALTPQKQPDRFIEVVRRLRAEGRPRPCRHGRRRTACRDTGPFGGG